MKYKFIFILSIAIFVSGCSVFSPIGDVISTGYQSFVGYFNTYYNAKKAFEQGEESIYNFYNPKSIYPNLDKLREISYNDVPSDARMKFDAVIEKCSKILNSYNKSALVDDAILLIGKSYFYNLEYTRAERKFLELLSQYPQSDLIPEAKIWCAKAFLKNRREEDAKLVLQDVINYAKKEDELDLIVKSNLILSDYYLSKNDTNDAIKYYLDALNYSDSKEINSQILYRLGEIFEKYDSLLLASDYYFKASDISSNKFIKYWGLNKYGCIQTKLGKYELATRIFRDLEKDNQLREFLPYTYYELAYIKLQTKDLDAAIDLFQMLDTTYSKTEAAAKGYYQLGMIYENIFKDYESARNNYQKSKEQMVGLSITPFVDDKLKKLEVFLSTQKQAKISDSLYIQANVPDTSVVYKFEVNISSLEKDSSLLFSMMQKDSNYSRLLETDSLKLIIRDSIINYLAKNDSTLIKDTTLKIIKTHIDTIRSIDGTTLKYQHYISKYSINNQKIDTILITELDRILVNDTARIKKASKDLARKKYDLALSYMNDLERLDTAIIIFEDILENYQTDKNYHPELLYNLASAYKKQNSEDEKADSLLKVFIKEYPDNIYVSDAKIKLGMSFGVKIDTAKVLYSVADSLYVVGKINESINVFEEIVKKFPANQFAPKALYAIGWIYENKNNFKEAIDKYQKLIESYPNSNYAKLVKAKIDTVEKYIPQKKKDLAKKDSLKKEDSLNTMHSKIQNNIENEQNKYDTIKPQEEIKSTSDKPKIKSDTTIIRRRREVE